MHVNTLADNNPPRAAKQGAIDRIRKTYKSKRPKDESGGDNRKSVDLDETELEDEQTGTGGEHASDKPGQGPAVVNGGSGQEVMVDFEDEDGVDGPSAHDKADRIKLEYDRADVEYWIQRLETRLECAQVKSQWAKRLFLENLLPPDVATSVKDLFALKQSQAGKDINKKCKTRLLKVYAKNPEQKFLEAQALVLTGLPSEAAKQLRELCCQKPKPLETCCCATAVGAFWKKLLPPQVRAAVAGQDLAGDFDDIVQHADDVFLSMKSDVKAVSAVSDLDTTLPALQHDVAAFKKQQKKTNKKGHKPDYKGDKSDKKESAPPNACSNHKKWGKKAFYCSDVDSCPWEAFTAPPQDKKK